MFKEIWQHVRPKEIVPTILDETIRYVVTTILAALGVWLLANISIIGTWLRLEVTLAWSLLVMALAVLFLMGIFAGRMSQQRRLVDLASRASRDILTGLLNQREFIERLPQEMARAKRQKQALSIVLIDIDSFKRINDTYSYTAGDQVLKQFASFLSGGVHRKTDLVFRYKQGDEFVLLLPDTPLEGARYVAENLRSLLTNRNFQARPDKPKERITLSAGVVAHDTKDDNAGALINRAETALSQAKSTKDVVVAL